ncbi:rhodanese-related sulfurtransferase [Sphingomonas sp.]|uniref:oxygen-dependent tRNA uridine(34) hydroxylase TrhO n=1 Tax=Sphingomonas sp. TaxID=28214 RepID=UPI0035BBA282
MIAVAALYRFTRFDDPHTIRGRVAARCEALGIRGTMLLASEGINGTIAGAPHAIDAVLADLRALPGCADLDVKRSTAARMPFHRLKVRVKREIVTMGQAVDPANAGSYVAPAEWNALVADPDTVVIDTRNAYEVAVGTFPGAIDPGTAGFADFPAWFRAHREELVGKRVAMFCTGGIRCEKATALLKREGVDEVHHLKGGILRYLEEVPVAESLWTGECFVFDERVAVGQGLSPGTHVLCRACRMPVSPEDCESQDYVEGVACPHCRDARNEAQRAGYAERHRQQALAEQRDEKHVGARSAHPHPSPQTCSGAQRSAGEPTGGA